MTAQILPNNEREQCSHGWIHPQKATLPKRTTALPEPGILRATDLHLTLSTPEQLYKAGLDELENHNLNGAADSFRAAIQLRWNFPAAHIQLGNIASALSDYDQAFHAYNSVIEIDPAEPAAYYNVALTYADLNDFASAQEWLRRTITIDRTYTQAYLELANLFIKERKERSAIAVLLKAANQNSPSPDALVRAGQLYYRNTHYRKAIECYQRAIQIDIWHTDAFFHLGLAQYRNGEFGKATLSLAHVLNQDPKNKLAGAIMKLAHKLLRPRKEKQASPTQARFPFPTTN